MISILFGLLSVMEGTVLAGPWTPEPGGGYAKLWVRWHWGFLDYADGQGDLIDIGDYQEVFFSTYGDVGLTDGLALFWHSDILRLMVLEDPRDGQTSRHAAPGDPLVGLRWRWLQVDRLVFSLEGAIRAPLARSRVVQAVYAQAAPHERIGGLRVGAGVWEVNTKVWVGYGFDIWHLAGAVGYQWRASGFDDRVSWIAEAGVNFSPAWIGRLRVGGAHSLDENGAPPSESPSGMVTVFRGPGWRSRSTTDGRSAGWLV